MCMCPKHLKTIVMLIDAYNASIILNAYAYLLNFYLNYITGPKLRFPTCPAYQNVTFPTHIW